MLMALALDHMRRTLSPDAAEAPWYLPSEGLTGIRAGRRLVVAYRPIILRTMLDHLFQERVVHPLLDSFRPGICSILVVNPMQIGITVETIPLRIHDKLGLALNGVTFRQERLSIGIRQSLRRSQSGKLVFLRRLGGVIGNGLGLEILGFGEVSRSADPSHGPGV